jgi:hypothetical protein
MPDVITPVCTRRRRRQKGRFDQMGVSCVYRIKVPRRTDEILAAILEVPFAARAADGTRL